MTCSRSVYNALSPVTSTHEPIDAPQSYVDHFSKIADMKRRTFVGMVLALDDSIKTVTDSLKSAGYWPNTIVCVHSDNGGNLGAAGNNMPLRGGAPTACLPVTHRCLLTAAHHCLPSCLPACLLACPHASFLAGRSNRTRQILGT